MENRLKKLIALIVLTSVAALTGCGGGGGGDDSGGTADGDPCSSLNPRITNGQVCSNEDSSPVALLALFDSRDQIYGICSGTLISKRKILTAAHCLEETAGIVALIAGEELIVDAAVSNPLYDGQAGSPFDVAVLTLEVNSRASPVAILGSDLPKVSESITIYGYGETESQSETEDLKLRAAFMRIQALENGNIVAAYNSTGSSTCLGDSGGPAVIERNGEFVIAAVSTAVTAGSNCQEGSLAVFASVSTAINFSFITNNAPDVLVK
jgi:hypothetical protein